MASLHKQPGKPNWFCAFTDQTGKRHFKSTGTDDKKQAQQICRTWANAALHGDSLTPEKAREIITRGVADVLLAAGQTLPSATIKDWCARWLETKALENEESTHTRYSLAIHDFLSFLGPKAEKNLEHLSVDDVLKFREESAKRMSVESVNTNLRVVRACLNAAWRQRLIERNVAAQVAAMKNKETSKRRALSDDEVKHVLLTCGDTPWRGLVLVGYYTGQRLSDCASLRWEQVDLLASTIKFKTKKTGKELELHLHKGLADFFAKLPSSDNPKDFIFPRFAEMAERYASSLSNAFALEVLIPAGLMPPRPANKKSTGVGRKGKRVINEVSFHSLRHAFTTNLKRTGASNAVAQMVVGHDSPVVSAHYTHLAAKDTVQPIDSLPDITK